MTDIEGLLDNLRFLAARLDTPQEAAVIDDAIAALESMRWVAVGERLPPLNQRVDTLSVTGYEAIAYRDYDVPRYQKDFYEPNTRRVLLHVTHWRERPPLPAPPKEDKEARALLSDMGTGGEG